MTGPNQRIVCWEALEPDAAYLGDVRRLYESTLDERERIPWEWIAGAVQDRPAWRPGRWSPHLVVAGPRDDSVTPVLGFGYGLHVPDYGGYVCYLGVDPLRRSRGVGTQLMRVLSGLFRVDAACEGAPLPFLVWESGAPKGPSDEIERARWQARLRFFERVGAWWVAGLTFLAPDFAHRGGAAVPLQLFLLPMEMPAGAFDGPALREVAAGLMRKVYGRREGDPLFDQSLPADCRPSLRPVTELRGEARWT